MKRQHGRHRPAAAQQRPAGRAAAPTTPAAPPSRADRAVAEGVQHHRVGRFAEAETHYRRALTHEPTHAEALHLLGLLAHQLGQYDMAVGLIGRAIMSASDRPLYYLNIGASLQALGRFDLAIQTCRQAIALRSDYPEAFNNLGVALQAQGSLYEAVDCFEQALALRPGYAEAHYNLGVARQADGRDDLAVACYRAALAIQPEYLSAQYNLGNAQRMLRQFDEAAASYRAVLTIDPNHVDACNNLGVVLQDLSERTAAIACFERTISLQPTYPNAHTNLGHALRERGLLDEAIESYRRALELRPNDELAHSGIIFSLDHHPACTLEMAFAERRAWNAAHAAALTAAAPPHTNTPDPDRPLRVGYVSANFCAHSAAMAFGPIFAHDPRQVEVVCYADVIAPDQRTAWFASRAQVWRNIVGWTDEALAEQIRADRIDILVDLVGHSGKHRLLAFARKPAPIQATAWGYITGTGLDAIDVMFADPVVIRADEHRWFAEEVVNLPSLMCLEVTPNLPAVVPPPSATSGALTFGCFNAVYKLSPAVYDVWATIVAAVPGSRILLKSPGLDDEENRSRLLTAFAAHGVGPDRIDILGNTTRYEHLATHSLVDVQLDPFPTGGGVTTFEGLLMGVPCVTLLGDRLSGRVSASFLTTLGLTDLIAHSTDEYIAIATGLAQRLDWLASQRTTLRERVLASPIADNDLYTRALESTYRTLWQRWCGEETELVLSAAKEDRRQETGEGTQEAPHRLNESRSEGRISGRPFQGIAS
jgi:predicted O-linked N-acetylglucosamine transferase (SPINDLY family)